MLDKMLLMELQEYVDKYIGKLVSDICASPVYSCEKYCSEIPSVELEDFIKNNRKPTFNQVLFGFIDKKGAADSEVYKKAGIDRRHFSKIRSNDNYRIGKNAAIALALALELDSEEMNRLLSAAGYSLSDSDTFDLVIQFCVNKRIYNIFDVNQALDYFSLKPLVGSLE